ncbi:MAG: hypothetical protein QOK25_2060 [Thermoleophilaceae bacterium]|jgi:ABC-type transport system substrate-binding protein|nr:hypothetical protein [Thermoleophilaceae bacterium]
MDRMRRRVVVAALTASTFVGGAVGATVFSAASGSAKTSTTTAAPAAATTPGPGGPGVAGPGGPPPGGRFRSIETKAHEAGESKQREAQEAAGQVPTVP